MKKSLLIAAAIISLGALTMQADDTQGQRPDGQRGGRGGHHPAPPFIAALDVNQDGVIDADELANAVAALKTLDKNGDGKLTRDELMPPHGRDGEGRGEGRGPGGRGGEGHGPGGPGQDRPPSE